MTYTQKIFFPCHCTRQIKLLMNHSHKHIKNYPGSSSHSKHIMLSNVMKNKPAKFARATKRTIEWVIDNVKGYLKSKMASSDDRFTFEIVYVLSFGNKPNKELCCRFIFTNLQQSLDLQVRCDQKFQSPIWRLIFRIWSPK